MINKKNIINKILTGVLSTIVLLTLVTNVQAEDNQYNSYTINYNNSTYYNSKDESLRYSDDSGDCEACQDNAVYLNVYDDSIYYINKSDNDKIYQLSETDKNAITDDPCSNLIVLNENLYYINSTNGKIYKSDLDGENEEAISPKLKNKITEFVIDEKSNTIYYSYNASLYKYTIDKDTKSTKLTSAFGTLENINLYNNKLYFIKDSRMYKCNLDGKKLLKINNTDAYCMKVYNNYIYYINGRNSSRVYRCTIAGSNNKMIFRGVTGEKITHYGDYNINHIDTLDNRLYLYTYSGIGYQCDLDGSDLCNIDGTELDDEE